MSTNDIGKRAHVLNHSNGRCVVYALGKNYMKDIFGLDPYQFYLLSYTNQYFFTLYIMIQNFMMIYINTDGRKIYIDDYGSGIFPK